MRPGREKFSRGRSGKPVYPLRPCVWDNPSAGASNSGRRLEARFGICYYQGVFFRKKDKPRERFYLFPGQGGRNYRRKQRLIMRWTLAVSLLAAAVLAAVLWWLARP